MKTDNTLDPESTLAGELDGGGCTPTHGSDFWDCVRQTAETIVETLPNCGSGNLVNESQALRRELSRIVGIMERASLSLPKLDSQNAEVSDLRRQLDAECKSWNTLTNEIAELRIENALLRRGIITEDNHER